MDILNRFIILMLPFLLSSCFTEFDPNIRSNPKLCINSLITPGDTIKVNVTRTWTWDEGDINDEHQSHGIDVTIYDAEVNLYVNGDFIETLQPQLVIRNEGIYDYGYPFVHRYVANYIPKVGDDIEIVAKNEKYGEARGSVIIPDPPHLESITAEIKNVSHSTSVWSGVESLDFILTMTLSFTDNPSDTDYYKFMGSSSRTETPEGYTYPLSFGYLDSSFEPLFSEHVSALESVVSQTSGYLFFSDLQISGSTYPLHIRYDRACYTPNDGLENLTDDDPVVTLTMATISKSYYDHVISVWVANDGIVGTLGSVGLGDPIFASSNVSTEAGVIAAQSPASIEVHIGNQLREAVKRLDEK